MFLSLGFTVCDQAWVYTMAGVSNGAFSLSLLMGFLRGMGERALRFLSHGWGRFLLAFLFGNRLYDLSALTTIRPFLLDHAQQVSKRYFILYVFVSYDYRFEELWLSQSSLSEPHLLPDHVCLGLRGGRSFFFDGPPCCLLPLDCVSTCVSLTSASVGMEVGS